MKKILLIALISLFALPTFAQYGKMLEDGRRWVTAVMEMESSEEYEEYLKFIIAEEGYSGVRNIMIKGDTAISGNTYKKLYVSNFITSEDDWTTIDKLEAFIRCKNGKYLYRFINDGNIEEYKKNFPNSFEGDDFVLFDENWVVGDTTDRKDEVIVEISDTLNHPLYSNTALKHWKIKDIANRYRINYFEYFNDIKWIQGVGFPTTLIPHHTYNLDCVCEDALLFCIAANGDTVYQNRHYWFPNLATGIATVPEFSISTTASAGGLSVNIGTDIPQWSATLYNSNGICVEQKDGAGSEMFLSTDSKGTHILVVKAGGRVVKKKIALKAQQLR